MILLKNLKFSWITDLKIILSENFIENNFARNSNWLLEYQNFCSIAYHFLVFNEIISII